MCREKGRKRGASKRGKKEKRTRENRSEHPEPGSQTARDLEDSHETSKTFPELP